MFAPVQPCKVVVFSISALRYFRLGLGLELKPNSNILSESKPPLSNALMYSPE